MLVIPAYYDGNTVRTVDDYKFTKNQKLKNKMNKI